MKKNRVKYSDVLIEAKKHLMGPRWSRNKNPYVCHCIARAAMALGVPEKGQILQRKIMKALKEKTVTMWLVAQGIPWSKLSDSAVQRYRHEWLDHLIKQYKEAGK